MPTRRQIRSVSTLLVAAVLGVITTGVVASPAWAATIAVTVQSDGDANGACTNSAVVTPAVPVTLRNALCVASNLGAAQTVTVPAGTYTLGVLGPLIVGTTPGADITVTGIGGPNVVGNGSTQLMILDPALVGDVDVTIEGIDFSGGVDNVFGGGAIIGGSATSGVADSLTVRDATFTGNAAGAGTGANPGGAIQFMGGSLTVEDSTFTNNTAGLSAGGAIYYEAMGAAGEALTVTGSTFTGNTVQAAAVLPNGGGAIAYAVTGGSATVTLSGNDFAGNIASSAVAAPTPGGAVWQKTGAGSAVSVVTGNTFTGNVSQGGATRGGAIDLETGSATLRFNRFHGNTGSAAVRSDAAASVDATENWWGCATGPGAAPCDAVSLAAGSASPYLTLAATASPGAVLPGETSTLTASMLLDSAGGPVAPVDLGAFDGLAVAWSGAAPAGSAVSPASSALSGGVATTTFTAGTTGGVGGANAALDAASVSAPVTVNAPAVFTSANTLNVSVGVPVSFTVTTSGFPTPTASLTGGALPTGLAFTDNGDGTATIAGTVAAGTPEHSVVTLTATNGIGSPATQQLAIDVVEAPAFTSAASVTVIAGEPANVLITASGLPAPAITLGEGALPAGLQFVDHGDGTASITGTASAADGGVYPLTRQAQNSAGAVDEPFMLTVGVVPVITSADATTFSVGTPGSFGVTADVGFPATTVLTLTGALPAGVTFAAGVPGTATLAGTPAAGTAGVYPLTFTATNTSGVDTQPFTLTVNEAPVVTTQPVAASVLDGATATFTAVATGFPVPTVQWQRSPDGIAWTDIPGATSTTLSFTATLADDGARFHAVFTGAGTATSDPAALAVGTVPAFGTLGIVSVLPGAARSIEISATGHPAPVIAATAGLPAWLTLTDHGDGTATLAGTPTIADVGSSAISLTTTNAFGAASGTLTVDVAGGVPLPVVLPTPDGVLGGVPAQTLRGQTFTVTGDGFLPGSTVTLGIYSSPTTLGTTIAGAGGAISASVTIPADQTLGAHTIAASGISAGGDTRLLAADTTVVEPAPSGGGTGSGSTSTSSGSLSSTGVDPLIWMLLAGFAVALGAALVRRSRRA